VSIAVTGQKSEVLSPDLDDGNQVRGQTEGGGNFDLFDHFRTLQLVQPASSDYGDSCFHGIRSPRIVGIS
jgi:hypothetical protein